MGIGKFSHLLSTYVAVFMTNKSSSQGTYSIVISNLLNPLSPGDFHIKVTRMLVGRLKLNP